MKWKKIRKLLSKVSKISPEVLDFLSCYDILLLSVSGMSTNEIQVFLDVRRSAIDSAIKYYIESIIPGWRGYEVSLGFNPYFIYRKLSSKLGRLPQYAEFYNSVPRDKKELVNQEMYDSVITFDTLRYNYLIKYRLDDEKLKGDNKWNSVQRTS